MAGAVSQAGSFPLGHCLREIGIGQGYQNVGIWGWKFGSLQKYLYGTTNRDVGAGFLGQNNQKNK
jgi:hypothetical protein